MNSTRLPLPVFMQEHWGDVYKLEFTTYPRYTLSLRAGINRYRKDGTQVEKT